MPIAEKIFIALFMLPALVPMFEEIFLSARSGKCTRP